jgi:hypothetical protein
MSGPLLWRTMVLVARRRPNLGAPRRGRPSVLGSLLEGAGELVQSVAVDVVPPVVDALDIDAVVQRVDIDALLDRVDVDALVDRIDLTRLIEQVDLDVLLAKVDVNALLLRVDIDALLARTEFGEIAARSGGAVASRALDVVRSQCVGVDTFIERWMAKLLRRRPARGHSGPPLLVAGGEGARS